MRPRILVFAAAVSVILAGVAPPVQARIPVGGLDIFSDYIYSHSSHGDHYGFGNFGLLTGPVRVSAYGVSLGGISNRDSTPEAVAAAVSGELALFGPLTFGGSFGKADSDSLAWSQAALEGSFYITPFFALHLGVIDETFDYPDNNARGDNLSRNELNGPMGGASLFGSPTPGVFFQLDTYVFPVRGVRFDGTTTSDSYRFRAGGLAGFAFYDCFDLSFFAHGTSGLGDDEGTSIMVGAGASFTY